MSSGYVGESRDSRPTYEYVASAAWWLNIFAMTMNLLGSVTIIIGFGIGVAGLLAMYTDSGRTIPPYLLNSIGIVVAGLVGVCIGAVLNMLAAIGLAVRDIARNSHR